MAHANTYDNSNASNHSELLGLSNLTLQPYESNLNSKENLEERYQILVLQVNSTNGSQLREYNSCLAAVCYQLGRIYYDTEDDPARAESMFLKAKDTVKDHESEADNILSVINSLNMLGYIKVKNNEDYERALQYLLEAQCVYQEYSELKWGSATSVGQLLPNFPIKRTLLTNKNPLINARLFTLFYIIEVYKHHGNITDALLCTHQTLKIQLENNVFLQSPLDWALSSALIANLLCQQNAYQQARHHLAAASTFMEKIIPKQYVNLFKCVFLLPLSIQNKYII
uniref:Protein KBP n=1 Tax=Melanaphis sacchari TaxID=742174 RepID=A0A2H8TGI1_9HEMI